LEKKLVPLNNFEWQDNFVRLKVEKKNTTRNINEMLKF